MQIIFIKLVIILNFIILLIKNKNEDFSNFIANNSNSKFNNYFIFILNNEQYLNLTEIKYKFSFTFNLIRIEYIFGFYENNNLILPSDLALYKNLILICYIEVLDNIKVIINSLANIHKNRYYRCVEYYKINEIINFGIKLYEKKENVNLLIRNIPFLTKRKFKYNNLLYKNEHLFDYYILNEKYKKKIKMMEYETINKSLKLEKSYIRYPYLLLKRNYNIKINTWRFGNIFNDYFCFCKGSGCLNSKIKLEESKYYFYLNIIDLNKNIYKKSDYLFIDFIFSEFSSDDAYPVFKEMFNQKFPVHYITENMEIYNEFCNKKSKCSSILYVNKNNYTINGNFLEKHLTIILRLKQVISGGGTYFNYINNLFYNIEYITFISITHGVCYFKYFLYKDFACYGTKRIEKILIPPSDKIISLAKKYGWKDENIIKINLPKWDKYNKKNKNFILESESYYKINSIFIFFTWREIIKNKKISSQYYDNIIALLKSKSLINSLKKYNITLYFAFHHKIDSYQKYTNLIKQYKGLQLVEENKISQCILWSSLLITDFSSIVFDFIYRGKPFILFIPDISDHNLKKIYNKEYSELIQSIKNGTIEFENQYLNVNDTINKTLFYINNNFTLDLNLKIFYDKLKIKEEENNTNKFIKYIINLK